MIQNRLSRRLLRLLLSSRQNDEIIDFMDACEACGARPYAVLKALHALGAAGLVEPARLRLTFEGLAVASALCCPSHGPAGSGPAEPTPESARCVGGARCAARGARRATPRSRCPLGARGGGALGARRVVALAEARSPGGDLAPR